MALIWTEPPPDPPARRHVGRLPIEQRPPQDEEPEPPHPSNCVCADHSPEPYEEQ